GQGNDTFTVKGTLLPGAEFANNATPSCLIAHPADFLAACAKVASHGGITTVHGGGNTALSVTGSFDTTATTIRRADGVDWSTQGFKIGQTLQIGTNTVTITSIAGPAAEPNSVLTVIGASGALTS